MLRAHRICSIFIVLITSLNSSRAADPPAIARLIPSGGQRGTTVDVRLIGKPGDGELKVISDDEAIVFTLNEKRDSASSVIGAAARPGVHWLRFCNAEGATELLPFIVGLIPEVVETEPNARIAEANSVALPSVTVNGVLEKAGDVDTFAVTLSKGQTIVCALQARAVLGAPMDAILQISDARGIVLEQNDDDLGFDPRLSFTAPNDGTWYVRTFAFPADPNSTINFAGGADYVYRLTLTTAAVVEHTEPVVRFDQQNEASVTIFGWNIEAATVSLAREQAQLTEPYALAYPVRSSSIPSIVESQLAADRTLPFPVAVTGRVTSSADTIFLFNATKGQKLSLSVQAQRVGSLLDPVLIVEDGSGKVIQETDDISGDNRDAELHLTMPTDGQYRLIIRDRFRNFGDRCFYLLRGEETRATFNPTITSTAGTLKPDKTLEIPITFDRKHGFSEPVDIRVEGLPEGIVFECPRSEKDGETSKTVNVKISGTTTAAFQGPLRIVTESAESKQLLPATFTTADGSSIAEYWLTAPKQDVAPHEQ